jgi:hypothetical protein
MNPTFTGGCVCGATRYECTAEPGEIQMFKCHCRDCQKVTGGGYAPVVYVPAKTLQIVRGTVRHHLTPSEMNGEHKRGYCPQCGSRLTGGEGPGSTGIGVTASSLDDPSFFRPQLEMWTSDAQPWDALDASIPHFKKYPPG